MRFRRGWSTSSATTMPVTLRFCLRVRLIRRWPFQPCVRAIFPLPVFLNRFAAARRVLTFGTVGLLVLFFFLFEIVRLFFGFGCRLSLGVGLGLLRRLGRAPRLDLLDRRTVGPEHHREHPAFHLR